MKKIFLLTFVLTIGTFIHSFAQKTSDPWKDSDLEAPADLAAAITAGGAKQPLVIGIGPAALIKGSVDIGPAQDPENIDKFKALLARQPKDRQIVIYCGCCPFARCPNVRPAFTVLKEMKFTHARLLNLSHNLKTDWIDKGYPTNN